jgi:hypothetical protein
MVLPSARSAVRALSVVVTRVASGSLTSVPEILIPFLHEEQLILLNSSLNSPKLRAGKSPAPLQPDRIDPELCCGIIPLHVDMGRFAPIR